jgi:uncharacterized membrane protein
VVSLSTADWAAVGTAFLVALIEMTDVFALVYALGAGARSMRPGLQGATGGVAVVALIGIVIGSGLSLAQTEFSEAAIHVTATVVLWGFGVVLFRSTLKSYIQEARKQAGRPTPKKTFRDPGSMTWSELTILGFTVGATETFEAVVPLLALSAQGMAPEAIVGGILGGLVLVPIGWVLRERVKRIKVPPLKWVTTSAVFAFAAQWTFEALVEVGATPLSPNTSAFELALFIPPFLIAALLVTRGTIELWVRDERRRAAG